MKKKYINDVWGYCFYYNGITATIILGILGNIEADIATYSIFIPFNILLSYLYLAFFSCDIYITNNILILKKRFFPFYLIYKIRKVEIEKVKMSPKTQWRTFFCIKYIDFILKNGETKRVYCFLIPYAEDEGNYSSMVEPTGNNLYRLYNDFYDMGLIK
jgi:hypothetical protein